MTASPKPSGETPLLFLPVGETPSFLVIDFFLVSNFAGSSFFGEVFLMLALLAGSSGTLLLFLVGVVFLLVYYGLGSKDDSPSY